MQGSDALQVVAEISLGLAGFSGVVVALARREPTGWDLFRAFSLLSGAFGALLLSLLPFGLDFSGVSPGVTWRIASAVMASYSAIVFYFGYRAQHRLDPAGIPYYGVAAAIAVFGTAINILAQSLNALALGLPGTLAPFFWGLLWFVAYTALQFSFIVFIRPRTPAA